MRKDEKKFRKTAKAMTITVCVFLLSVSAVLAQDTPDWTENFSGLTGGPYRASASLWIDFNFLPPDTETLSGLTEGLAGQTKSWRWGMDPDTLDTYFMDKDTDYATLGNTGAAVGNVPSENSNRLAIKCGTNAANSPNGRTSIVSPISTSSSGAWKYECFTLAPFTAGTESSLGLRSMGAWIDGMVTAGVRDHEKLPFFYLELARDKDPARNKWQLWLVGGTLNETKVTSYEDGSGTLPWDADNISITNFSGQWIKLGFEHDPTNKKFIGYVNDAVAFEYTYSDAEVLGLDLTQSAFHSNSYGSIDNDWYLDDISYTGSGASSVDDWFLF